MAISQLLEALNRAWADTAAVQGYFNVNAFCPAPAIMPNGTTVTTQAACPTCATLFGSTGLGILLGPGPVQL